jgi:predicted nucleic acid-binding protein
VYLVDTSVWVHALRPSGHPAIQKLLQPLILSGEAALTDWIILELMTGLAKSEQPDSLLKRFEPLTRLAFDPSWWFKAWEHAARLRRKGISPAAADCLIATVAMGHGVPLLHCDSDFEAMKPVLPLSTVDWAIHLRGERQ